MFILGMITGAVIMFIGVLLGGAIAVGSQPRPSSMEDFEVDIPK